MVSKLCYRKWVASELGLYNLFWRRKKKIELKVPMPAVRRDENGKLDTYSTKLSGKRVKTSVELLDVYKASIRVLIKSPIDEVEKLIFIPDHRGPSYCRKEFHKKLEKEVFKMYVDNSRLRDLVTFEKIKF